MVRINGHRLVTLVIVGMIIFCLADRSLASSQYSVDESEVSEGAPLSNAEKWDPNDVQTEILGKPDQYFYGYFEFISNDDYVRRRDGWKLTIVPADAGGVTVTFDEESDGGARFLAKVIKVSEKEIILEQPPLWLDVYTFKLVLRGEPERTPKLDVLFINDLHGGWFSEDCYMKKIRELSKEEISLR